MKKAPVRRIPLITVCIFLFLFSPHLLGADYQPDYGLHSDGVDLVYNLGGADNFAAAAQTKGYSVLIVNLIPYYYYFISPTLAGLNYQFAEDLLTPLVAAAHSRGLLLFVDIQTLGWKARSWSGASEIPGDVPNTQEVVQVVEELAAYGIDGVSEEGFLSQWLAPVAQKCHEKGMLYLHKCTSFEPYDFVMDGNDQDVFHYFDQPDILMTMDYYLDEQLASNTFIPALARGLGKTYWMKSSPANWGTPGFGPGSVEMMDNVILLLALRERPPMIFHMIYTVENFNQINLNVIRDYFSEWALAENRPTANLLLYLTGLKGADEDHPKDDLSWLMLDRNLAAIQNALGASGYQSTVTSSPLPTSSLRFFYTRGVWWDGINPLNLNEGLMSIFTYPVKTFVQTAGVIPHQFSRWLEARAALGLNQRAYDYVNDTYEQALLPSSGVYQATSYTHFRPGPYESNMGDIQTSDVLSASILSTGNHGGYTFALLTANKDKYFINGGVLDLEAAYPLSSEMNGAMLTPANCIINSGRTTAFFPLEDLTLKFHFPLYPRARLKWMRRTAAGEEIRGSTDYFPTDGSQMTLKKWNLYLVTVDKYPTVPENGDYDGNGRDDIAIFRPSSGLWAVRGITRLYFGTSSDIPVSGDYDGDGTSDIGIFRGSSGFWAIRGKTRFYYGSPSDLPVPGDYDGDGSCDIGIFREASGLWAIRNITRAYFGTSGDLPIPGDYDGDGIKNIGIFRSTSGLWALRNISRIYFGSSTDTCVPGDYDGDGTWEPAIFRPTSGLWAVRGVTRYYFGKETDQPVPADYNGSGEDDIGIFRGNSSLWAVRGTTRLYYGSSGDIPVTR